MQQLFMLIACFFYAVFNVSGAALIKTEIPHHQLNSFNSYLHFLFTWRVISGFAVIMVSALIMFKALSLGQFSSVIPIATGINFSLTVLLGVLLFNDKLTMFSYLGLSLILGGILVMSLKTV